ncbi:hypothetical protein EPN44_01025 [bacterium]|nr:MAG: hypothetical protein EPN44_01025 [bacterium]
MNILRWSPGVPLVSTSLQVAFAKFVSLRFGEETWSKLLHDSSLAASMEPVSATGRGDALMPLLMATTRITNEHAAAVVEELGVFLAGQLISRYQRRIDPAWSTLDLIMHANRALALWFERRNATYEPAMRCARIGERTVRIVYASRRRLCPLIRGMIRGVAEHRGEAIRFLEGRCMMKGSSFCEILVELPVAAPA